MKITNQALAEMVLSRLKSRKPVVKQLAAYLVNEGRTRDLDAIMRLVRKLRLERSGQTEIDVVSAFAVPRPALERAAKMLGAEKPIFNSRIDKDLIGGARFTTLEQEIDLSLRRKIDNLKTATLN